MKGWSTKGFLSGIIYIFHNVKECGYFMPVGGDRQGTINTMYNVGW